MLETGEPSTTEVEEKSIQRCKPTEFLPKTELLQKNPFRQEM